MFTTSRYCSGEIRQAAKDLAGKSSDRYISRGKKTIAALSRMARACGHGIIFILDDSGHVGSLEIDEKGQWNWCMADDRTGRLHEGKMRP